MARVKSQLLAPGFAGVRTNEVHKNIMQRWLHGLKGVERQVERKTGSQEALRIGIRP